MSWANLSTEARWAVSRRVLEEGIHAVAEELEMQPQTLARRLRELKQYWTADVDEHEEADDSLWELLVEAETKWERENREYREVSLRLFSDKPAMIAFPACLQIGTRGVLYEMMARDFESLQADGVYVIGLGDYIHNPKVRTKQDHALYSMHLPDPDDQTRLAKRLFRPLNVLALVMGCHDHFTRMVAGSDGFQDWCDEQGCLNLGHGARLTVRLGDQDYDIAVRHKYRAESKINTTSAQRTLFNELWDSELIVLAHLHNPDLQKRFARGKETIWMRSGSYFKHDSYGDRLGGYQGIPGMASVILYPDRHKILPFFGGDLREALETLAHLRQKAEGQNRGTDGQTMESG